MDGVGGWFAQSSKYRASLCVSSFDWDIEKSGMARKLKRKVEKSYSNVDMYSENPSNAAPSAGCGKPKALRIWIALWAPPGHQRGDPIRGGSSRKRAPAPRLESIRWRKNQNAEDRLLEGDFDETVSVLWAMLCFLTEPALPNRIRQSCFCFTLKIWSAPVHFRGVGYCGNPRSQPPLGMSDDAWTSGAQITQSTSIFCLRQHFEIPKDQGSGKRRICEPLIRPASHNFRSHTSDGADSPFIVESRLPFSSTTTIVGWQLEAETFEKDINSASLCPSRLTPNTAANTTAPPILRRSVSIGRPIYTTTTTTIGYYYYEITILRPCMNQQCKVCNEPAAGFHFGAFTCEGCKSFFGRTYNNIGSISECKNNGECVINKKNRTSCKACRLRKCLMVGMSKSGSRYGRRSNWFKIHCLLQEQGSLPPAKLKEDVEEEDMSSNERR
ncbi:unnamed protein product [Nesidiocoris tenuis]|uniref:Nuclear receptor domain-containing protein n=1 Tax=Nesidiocoris tenuis TaxID=355587 RepID=A0A6H5GEP5_9HEMI|nr:unnamed protein product [Nesidiocoris tenuis]